ncbi:MULTISPECIES: DUF3558 domain-containing protein [unclassified Rhodococcus (in: high G+C Gram-positive bacteria)]|uniref:DUF3558 domain-containing protein n=1 Tax=unclassified Rhodococcus (in: high G+C Gram-positive bacteria) TaxID=192944 RepID=UPI0007BB7AF7|nr:MULTISPECIES: DUF3558 domain-containing protein [unclassified Rhodococcus (in: high G+C Gram-positive bacteria)]KZF11344.1 hypothetical protein A2J02_15320 [Rhodococcus sp. EPR-147]KZF12357.1 hypothetical protein A2J04_16980 [Rhodococcus sp. EPR-279]
MAILLLLTGCASAAGDDATPTAASTTIATPTTPWDPCTIPDEAIEQAGLNAETKESGIFGRDQNGFKICGWVSRSPADGYFVRIFVGLQSLDYIDDPAYFDRLQPVRVGTRDATQYQQIAADASRTCGIAFMAGAQLIRATLITGQLTGSPPYDPCTELNVVVAQLDPELPK